MTQEIYPWRTQYFLDYAVVIAAKREIAIRAGLIEPRTPTEQRWKDEGPRPVPQLESGTNPAREGEQA